MKQFFFHRTLGAKHKCILSFILCRAVVLFVVSPAESNIFDQRQLEYAIKECNPRVKVIRRTLTEVGQRAELGEDRRLFVWVLVSVKGNTQW